MKWGCVLDVRKLTLLREVALHGGVTAAAASLGISPSAVSQQITRLEAEIGVPLTLALGRGIELTQTARDLVASTEEVIALLEAAETAITEARAGLRGTVKLAGFHTFSVTALGDTVRHLERVAPDIDIEFVELDPEDALNELSARRADIALVDEYPGLPLPPGRGLVRSLVAREPVRAYVPHPGTDPARVAWIAEPRHSDSFLWMRSVCRSAGFEPLVQFVSPDFHVHRRLVEQGLAAAFLPQAVGAGLEASLIVNITGGKPMHRSIYTLVRRGAEHSPLIAACQSAISKATVAAIGSEPPQDDPASDVNNVQL